ncbi:MAG: hypothetical protein GY710_06235 [Desulfobacteraceae bacterium]|nr:hypothetical protein [Desulfobacteraceae bacterium]
MKGNKMTNTDWMKYTEMIKKEFKKNLENDEHINDIKVEEIIKITTILDSNKMVDLDVVYDAEIELMKKFPKHLFEFSIVHKSGTDNKWETFRDDILKEARKRK